MNNTPKTLRNDVVARLTDTTSAGSNVFSSTITPHLVNNLPAIVVFVPSRTGRNIDHTSVTTITDVVLEIDVIVSQHDNYADELDDLLEEVKQIIFAGTPNILNTYNNIDAYTEEITFQKDGETPIVSGIIQLPVQIWENWNG